MKKGFSIPEVMIAAGIVFILGFGVFYLFGNRTTPQETVNTETPEITDSEIVDTVPIDTTDEEIIAPPPSSGDLSGISTAIEDGVFISLGARKTAAIIFKNAGTQNFDGTQDELSKALFTASNSANAFFRLVSYGKFWLEGNINKIDGDIYKVTIPNPSAPCTPANLKTWSLAARDAAVAEGMVLADYDYVLHFHSESNCKSLGLPGLNPPGAIIDNFSLRAIAHEGGHAIGFNHSAAYECSKNGKRVTISNNCEIIEKGDPFDVMGDTGTSHVTMFKKGQIGWLDDSHTQTIVQDGTYSFAPAEENSSAVKVLRIPRTLNSTGVEQFLYLEFRQPAQFNNFTASSPVTNGVSLRLASEYNRKGRSYLLDTHPETTTRNDAPLMPGETFTDPETGMSVTVVNTNSSGATVNIKTGSPNTCTYGTPTGTLTLTPSSPTSAGSTHTFNVTITNTDSPSCPIVTMTAAAVNLPAGWTEVNKEAEMNIQAGETKTRPINLISPSSISPGNYPISILIKNLSTGLSANLTTTITISP